jgi:hypothetical protein
MTEMVELMMKDPGTQQLLLSKLPPHMRKPEVLRAMMANPEVKQRISALAKSTVRIQKGQQKVGAFTTHTCPTRSKCAAVNIHQHTH